jgi:hypothetical protein
MEDLESKILKVLQEYTEPLGPSHIALLVGFPRPTNTATKVNPTLYKLLKEDKIVKNCQENGSCPVWSIKK